MLCWHCTQFFLLFFINQFSGWSTTATLKMLQSAMWFLPDQIRINQILILQEAQAAMTTVATTIAILVCWWPPSFWAFSWLWPWPDSWPSPTTIAKRGEGERHFLCFSLIFFFLPKIHAKIMAVFLMMTFLKSFTHFFSLRLNFSLALI